MSSLVHSIASRLELFVDDWLIESMDGVCLRMHSPTPREIVLNADGGDLGYVTVFKDDDCYRMYYRGVLNSPMNHLTCYAQSKDGIQWERPELGLIEYNGSKANNVIWNAQGMIPLRPGGMEVTSEELKWAWSVMRQREDAAREAALMIDEMEKRAAEGPSGSTLPTYSPQQEALISSLKAFRHGGPASTTHNFAPFKDTNPAAPPDQRYKAIGGSGINGLFAMASPDAIHWRFLSQEPIIHKGEHPGSRNDSQNVAFYDSLRGEYVAFHRDVRRNYRAIRRSASSDFIHWSDPEWIDLGDTPDEHLYTNAITPYFRAPHLYLGFPRRFVGFRKLPKDAPWPEAISDQVFMTSRDGGQRWSRQFMEAFIRPGLDKENWTDRCGTISWGVVPTSDREMSLYWIEHLRHPTLRMRRGTLRLDGFASVHAGYRGGQFVTHPFTFTGRSLYLNYSTSAVGSIQVELQEAESGRAIGAFRLEDNLIYGDEIEGLVTWRGGSDLSHFFGKAVRLRFVMKDADVYALQFR